MSWKCKLIEYGTGVNGKTLQIGDMFYGPTPEMIAQEDKLPHEEQKGWYWPYFFCKDYKLSEYYKQNNSHRKPLLIWLPGHVLFCVDSKQVNNGHYCGPGWVVTGDAPHITVRPSIDLRGIYHGYIENGIVSDDVEGRRYDSQGCLLR